MRTVYALPALWALVMLPADNNQPLGQSPASELKDWRVVSTSGAVVRAEAVTSVEISAPYFETVYLARVYNAAPVICGTFGSPELGDNGVTRIWRYTIAKPQSGPCTAAGGAYVAIGRRSGVDLNTPAVP